MKETILLSKLLKYLKMGIGVSINQCLFVGMKSDKKDRIIGGMKIWFGNVGNDLFIRVNLTEFMDKITLKTFLHSSVLYLT